MKTKDFLKKTHIEQNPSPEFRAKMRESLMAYMKNNPPVLHEAPVPRGPLPIFPRKALVISFASFMVLFAGTMGTVFAAQGTLPGDTLYGVKLAVDQLSIAVSNSPNVRMSVADRRLAEVKQVLAAQPDASVRTQADIQSALAQYRSNLQVVAAEMNASSSAPSAVQNIIQKTTDNERDLEQMISGNENATIVQGLADSLQSSEKTIAAANADLEDIEYGGAGHEGENYTDRETTSSTPLAISSAAPSAVLGIATSSPHRNDATNNVPSNGGEMGDRTLENLPYSHFPKKTLLLSPDSTSTVASTSAAVSVGGSDDQERTWNSTSSTPRTSVLTSPPVTIGTTVVTTTATTTTTPGGSDDYEWSRTPTSTVSASTSTLITVATTTAATTAAKGTASSTVTSATMSSTSTLAAATEGSDDRENSQTSTSTASTSTSTPAGAISTTTTSAVSATSTGASFGWHSGTSTQDGGDGGTDDKKNSD